MFNKQINKALAAVGVLILILLGIYYIDSGLVQDNQNTRAEDLASEENEAQLSISYMGVEGKNVLELLKENYETKTEFYQGIGEFVTEINGITAGDSYFWAMYVNGQMSQVGASEYITHEGDLVEWKLEKIK